MFPSAFCQFAVIQFPCKAQRKLSGFEEWDTSTPNGLGCQHKRYSPETSGGRDKGYLLTHLGMREVRKEEEEEDDDEEGRKQDEEEREAKVCCRICCPNGHLTPHTANSTWRGCLLMVQPC